PAATATLPLHDALPIYRPGLPAACLPPRRQERRRALLRTVPQRQRGAGEPELSAEGISRAPVRGQLLPQSHAAVPAVPDQPLYRSEEHTSELQSRENLV